MIDITVRLGPGLPGYPGDASYERMLLRDIVREGDCRLSKLTLSAHAGTHVDAPAHFLADGATLDRLPADFFSGPARVAACDASVLTAAVVRAARPRAGSFLLFRTPNSMLWRDACFHPAYTALDAGGAEALIAAGVRGVGVDYLSVEPPGSGGAVHRILLAAGLAVIEGLDLSAAEPGDYDLICLPLRLDGAEGAPARAVLLSRG
ncbi:MAG: cyclase family protein [Patescibacteria group bacterium]